MEMVKSWFSDWRDLHVMFINVLFELYKKGSSGKASGTGARVNAFTALSRNGCYFNWCKNVL